MGKKNHGASGNRKDKYERVDYGYMLKENPNKKEKSVANKIKEDTDMNMHENKKPEREITPEASTLCDMLREVVEDFIDSCLNGDKELDKKVVRNAFSFGEMPYSFDESTGELNKYQMYLLDRTIQFTYSGPDDHTGVFKRVGCSMVLVDAETKEPKFYADLYVNSNTISGVRVIPLGKYGPVHLNTCKWSNRKRASADVEIEPTVEAAAE